MREKKRERAVLKSQQPNGCMSSRMPGQEKEQQQPSCPPQGLSTEGGGLLDDGVNPHCFLSSWHGCLFPGSQTSCRSTAVLHNTFFSSGSGHLPLPSAGTTTSRSWAELLAVLAAGHLRGAGCCSFCPGLRLVPSTGHWLAWPWGQGSRRSGGVALGKAEKEGCWSQEGGVEEEEAGQPAGVQPTGPEFGP